MWIVSRPFHHISCFCFFCHILCIHFRYTLFTPFSKINVAMTCQDPFTLRTVTVMITILVSTLTYDNVLFLIGAHLLLQMLDLDTDWFSKICKVIPTILFLCCHCCCVDFPSLIRIEWLVTLYSNHPWCQWAFSHSLNEPLKREYDHRQYMPLHPQTTWFLVKVRLLSPSVLFCPEFSPWNVSRVLDRNSSKTESLQLTNM